MIAITETIRGISVVIGSDTTGLSAALSDVNSQSRNIQSELKQVEKLLKLDPSNTELLAQKQKLLTDAVAATQDKLERLRTAQEQVNAQFAAGEISEGQYRAFQREVINTENELNRLTGRLNDTNTALTGLQSGTTQAQTNMINLSNSLEETGKKFSEAGESISNAGEKISAAVTVPILAAGAASVKFAGDFEESANKVATIADTTVMSMDDINKGVIALSNDTDISATEINESMYQVISATGDTSNALGYVEIASKAAIGGFTDTTTAVNGLTTVLNAYGLKGKDAMQSVSDQMLVAQNYGKTTFAEIAAGIGNVIPIAASLDIKTQDLFASIATLTKNGIGTSESITGIKAALSNVIKPSKDASDLANQLGLEFNAAHLKSVGWAQFIQEIGEKTKGNTEQMATLFGSVEALNTVTVLATTGSKDFAGALDAMGQSAGSTQKAYDTMNQGLNDGIEGTLNQAKNLAISFGEMLLPVINDLVGRLQQLIAWTGGLSDSQKETIIRIAGVVAAIGPAILIIGKLTSGVGAVMSAFSAGAAALAGGSGFLGALTAVISPAGMVVAVVAAVAAAAYLIISNWGPIKDFFINLWNTITSGLTAAWEGIKLFFVDTWAAITTGVTLAWNKIGEFLTSLWQGITSTLSAAWEGIKSIAETIWNAIVSGITAIITPFVNAIIRVFQSMSDGLTTIFEGYKNYIIGVWEVIKNIFLGAILLIVDLVTGNFSKLKSDAEAIWNNLKDAFAQIWQGIQQIFTGALSALSGLLKLEWEGIKKIAETVWNALSDFLKGLWDSITSIAINAWNGFKTGVVTIVTNTIQLIKDLWNALLVWFTELPGKLYQFAVDMFTSMKKGVSEITPLVIDAIKTGLQVAIDWIADLPGKMLEYGKNIIQGLINGIMSMISSVKNAISGVVETITGGIRGALGINSPSRVMMEIGQYTGQGLALGMQSTISEITRQAQSLARAAVPNAAPESSGGYSSGGKQSAATGGITQNINIQAPTPLSPSETARQVKNVSRRLALEW